VCVVGACEHALACGHALAFVRSSARFSLCMHIYVFAYAMCSACMWLPVWHKSACAFCVCTDHRGRGSWSFVWMGVAGEVGEPPPLYYATQQPLILPIGQK